MRYTIGDCVKVIGKGLMHSGQLGYITEVGFDNYKVEFIKGVDGFYLERSLELVIEEPQMLNRVILKDSAWSTQEAGSHYKEMAIQPMEFSMANNFNALQHTIIKYVSRYKAKNGIEDLKKAKHSIEMLIEYETKNDKK